MYNHGLIGGISQNAANPGKQTRLPSYISSENFSLALLDILGTRGIISAEYGDLLAAAESADDAYDEALRAAGGAASDPKLAEAVEAAKTLRNKPGPRLKQLRTRPRQRTTRPCKRPMPSQAKRNSPGAHWRREMPRRKFAPR